MSPFWGIGWLGHRLPPGAKLWPFPRLRFAQCIRELSNLLGVSHLRLLLSSLRAGGATHFYVQRTDPSRLKYWGRWVAERSVAHYLQEA